MKNILIALTIALNACSSMNTATAGPDDSAIRNEVRAYLDSDGFDKIAVTVNHGVVTLAGHLASRTYGEKAASDAEKANGVKKVVNKIEVP